MSDKLKMWTIYDHPADHPDAFVARLWEVDGSGFKAGSIVIWSADLEEMRAAMRSRGLTVLPRNPEDDAVIVETWL